MSGTNRKIAFLERPRGSVAKAESGRDRGTASSSRPAFPSPGSVPAASMPTLFTVEDARQTARIASFTLRIRSITLNLLSFSVRLVIFSYILSLLTLQLLLFSSQIVLFSNTLLSFSGRFVIFSYILFAFSPPFSTVALVVTFPPGICPPGATAWQSVITGSGAVLFRCAYDNRCRAPGTARCVAAT